MVSSILALNKQLLCELKVYSKFKKESTYQGKKGEHQIKSLCKRLKHLLPNKGSKGLSATVYLLSLHDTQEHLCLIKS